MKLHQTQRREVVTTGDFRKEAMDITDRRGIAMAVHFLRDKLYTNKVLAVVREYMANAKDEHEKYCPDTPIEIQAPVWNDKVFRVRDKGKGLSEDSVFNVFGKMFKSTKAEENAIGGFGIGAKAGHAYSDSFSVISWHEGVKTTYEAVLETEFDEASGEELTFGQMYKLISEPSDELSGIEIIVNVKEQDVSAFQDAIKKVAKFWKVQPNCNITLSTPNKPLYSGEGWKVVDHVKYYSVDKSKVLIGEIGYDINTEEFSEPLLSGLQWIFELPLNVVSIAPNREGLEYTNRTKKVLDLTIKRCIDEFMAQIQAEVNKATNLLDAKTTLSSCISSLGYNAKKELENKFTFEGEVITPNTSLVCYKKEMTVYWKSENEIVGTRTNSTVLGKGDKLYYNIATNNSGGKNKARTLIDAGHTERITVVTLDTDAMLDTWCLNNGVPKKHFHGDWSKVEETRKKIERVKTSGGTRALIGKSHLHDYTGYGYNLSDAWPKFKSGLDNEAVYVWVPLNAKDKNVEYDFDELLNGMELNDRSLINSITEVCKQLGLEPKLIGVRRSGRERIPEHWVRFDHWVEEHLGAKKAEIKKAVEVSDTNALLPRSNWNSIWSKVEPTNLPTVLENFIKDLGDVVDTTVTTNDHNMLTVATVLGIEADSVSEAQRLSDLNDKFMEQYPLLSRINFWSSTNWDDVADYINALHNYRENT